MICTAINYKKNKFDGGEIMNKLIFPIVIGGGIFVLHYIISQSDLSPFEKKEAKNLLHFVSGGLFIANIIR